jgi:DNA polymerase-1
MYGQTSGPAGDTIKVMEQAYPSAVAYLRTAERLGREHTDIRTYGGRLIRLSAAAYGADGQPVTDAVAAGHGRFARNAVVQGPAAELFKAWAATVRDQLIDLDGRIVLCLHDELLIHVPVEHVEATVEIIHAALSLTARWWAAGTPVRLIAEVGYGTDWDSAH